MNNYIILILIIFIFFFGVVSYHLKRFHIYKEILKSIMEYDLNMYIFFNKKGYIEDFNQTAQLWFYNYFGINIEKKKRFENVFTGYILEEINSIVKNYEIKEPITIDKQFVTIYGEFLYINFSVIPIYKNKKIIKYLFIGKDITREKNAELNSKALALIPEEYPEPVLRIDYNGFVIYSNTEGKRFIDKNGYIKNELKENILVNYGTGKSGEFIFKDTSFIEEKIYIIIYKDIIESAYINVYGVDITSRYESDINVKSQYKELLYDLNKASDLVENILPEWCSKYQDYYFFLNYEPSNKVGGDIVDILKIDQDKLLIYIGDVSGHGVQAAIVMTAVKSVIKLMLLNYTKNKNIDLVNFATEINSVLSYEILKKNYLTLILGIIDLKENTFNYINCGHPDIIIYDRNNKKFRDFKEKVTIPMGWDKNFKYTIDDINKIKIEKEDSLLLFTDGVFSYDLFKSENMKNDLQNILLDCKEDNIFMLPYLLKEKIIEKYKDDFEDDYTILTINHFVKEENNYNVYLLHNQLNMVSNIGIDIYNFTFSKTYNKDLAFKAELLTNEFLNNLILYGGKSFEIFIELVIIDKNNILITFLDDSEKWDLEYNLEILDINKINDNLSPKGRGLHIIKNISKKIVRKFSNSINITKFYL